MGCFVGQFQFDIMDAAGYGYYRVWKERAYLFKLAVVPLFIKFACMVAVIAMNLDSNLLRAGLVLLPGDIALGWLMAQFMRTVLKDERWPMMLKEAPDESDFARLLLRARGIMSAMIIFVLVAMAGKFVLYAVLTGLSSSNLIQLEGGEPVLTGVETASSPYDPLIFLGSIAALAALIWSYRLIWLPIPFSVLMMPSDYLKAVRGFSSSVRMMVLYFCCMTPLMLTSIVLIRIVYGAFDMLGDAGEMPAQFFSILIRVMTEIVVTLVSATAMCWAMKSFLPIAPTALKDFPKKAD